MIDYAFSLAVSNFQMQIVEFSFEGQFELVANCNDVVDGEVGQQLFIFGNILISYIQSSRDLNDVTVDKGGVLTSIIVGLIIGVELSLSISYH